MKAWIIGDSFGVPNITTTWFEKANTEFYEGKMPDIDSVKGKEWTKQVAESLGYEYSIATNFSKRGCSNEAILHKIDWLINNDNMFDKNADILFIIPTVPNRFMYIDVNNINPFRFDYIEELHMPTAGSIDTHIPVIDEYRTLHRDFEFEEYKMISAYDKLLSHLKMLKIKYCFCPGMWTCKRGYSYLEKKEIIDDYGMATGRYDMALEHLRGYNPTNIDFKFPSYDIGLNADKNYVEMIFNRKIKEEEEWIYTHFAVADLYTNHMSNIGNDAYADAVLGYYRERS